MMRFDDCPALYEGELSRLLDGSQRGLCCDISDAFARSLGQAEHKMVTLHARGADKRNLYLLGIQGDVLRALCPETQRLIFLPLCSVYAFYEGPLHPPADEEFPIIRLDGGFSSRGCEGLAYELEGMIGRRVKLALPEVSAEMLITQVSGLTLRGVSADTIVTLRIDCIDVLECPYAEGA